MGLEGVQGVGADQSRDRRGCSAPPEAAASTAHWQVHGGADQTQEGCRRRESPNGAESLHGGQPEEAQCLLSDRGVAAARAGAFGGASGSFVN